MTALLEFRGGDSDFGDGWQHQHTRIPSEREADRYDGSASLRQRDPPVSATEAAQSSSDDATLHQQV